jgi:hypothetical protein
MKCFKRTKIGRAELAWYRVVWEWPFGEELVEDSEAIILIGYPITKRLDEKVALMRATAAVVAWTVRSVRGGIDREEMTDYQNQDPQ